MDEKAPTKIHFAPTIKTNSGTIMMKAMIPLLLLGASSATRLGVSNVGVEEVGDQIEFFAEEFPDRDELLARRLIEEAKEYAPDLDLIEVSSVD